MRQQGGPLVRPTEAELREFEWDLEETRCDVDGILILHGEAVDRVFIVLEGRLVASAEMLRDGLADLYLNIKASGVGFLQFDEVEKAAKIGYEASIDSLREWLEGGGLSDR